MKPRSRKAATIWTLCFSYSQIAYAIISGIVLVPLYLRYIPIELYGAWLATGNILAWLTVVDPGISTVVMQRAGKAYGGQDYASLAAFSWAGILLTAAVSGLILVAGWILLPHVTGWVGLSAPENVEALAITFRLAVVASALIVFSFAIGGINRALLGSIGPGSVTVAANVISIITTVVLILNGHGLPAIAWGLLSRAMSLLAGNVFYLCWRIFSEKISFGITASKLKETLRLLSFMSIGRTSAVFAHYTDAFFIARFIGPEAVPIFVLTRRGFSVAETFLGRSGNAISSGLSHLSGSGQSEKMRRVIIRLFQINGWMLGFAVGGFLAFNHAFVQLWVGEQFFAGMLVSGLFCCLLVGRIIFTVMDAVCVALGDIERTSVVSFIHSIVALLSLLAGVYYLGLVGAALGPLVGYLSVYLLYYPKAISRNAGLAWADWKILLREMGVAFGIAIPMGLGFLQWNPASWVGFAGLVFTYAIVFMLALIAISRSAREELASLVHTIYASRVARYMRLFSIK